MQDMKKDNPKHGVGYTRTFWGTYKQNFFNYLRFYIFEDIITLGKYFIVAIQKDKIERNQKLVILWYWGEYSGDLHYTGYGVLDTVWSTKTTDDGILDEMIKWQFGISRDEYNTRLAVIKISQQGSKDAEVNLDV